MADNMYLPLILEVLDEHDTSGQEDDSQKTHEIERMDRVTEQTEVIQD